MCPLSSEDPMELQLELQLSTHSALEHGTAIALVSRYSIRFTDRFSPLSH